LTKFLLLILVIVVAWRLAQSARRKNAAREASRAAPAQMVSCSHCGLYLPQSEAVSEGDKYFCCAEHRRLAA